MDSRMEKSADSSRALLFGLLINCLFPASEDESCPLWELRNALTFEKKYDFVMGLSKEEIENILVLHEECYEKKLPCFWQE